MRKICLALVLKRNDPKKYQVSKRFFIRKFINYKKLSDKTYNLLKLRYFLRKTTKNLLVLNSFLRPDRKLSELGPPLIKKAGSAPVYIYISI